MLIKLRKMMTNQKGFTLVELMVVVAIIGVLAAIAIPKFTASTGTAKDGKLTADLRTLDGIIVQIYASSNPPAYPATGITELEKAVVDKYLKEMPKGADGNALTYTLATDGTGYTLTGKSADGKKTITSPGSK